MEQLKKVNPKEDNKMNFKEIENFNKNDVKEENSNNNIDVGNLHAQFWRTFGHIRVFMYILPTMLYPRRII